MPRKKATSGPPVDQPGARPAAPARPPEKKKPGKPASKPGGAQAKAAQSRAKAKAAAPLPPPPAEKIPEPLFPIVGIGASAGGLEAFTHFLHNLPPDTGMGFVLIQHMAPRAHSMLPEILAKATPMPVTEVRDRMKVEPNRIYVTPPDIEMALKQGVLRLIPRPEPRAQHRPVDAFLRSLGEDRGPQAIGVILSGTASDGVMGMKVIKAEGGITFAQDEDSAKYFGMPQSSIAAGVVDFVLPPDQIAKELARIANHPYVRPKPEAKAEAPVEESDFLQILRLLRVRMGVDFTYYKHSTIQRRILRRMVLHQLEKLEDYLKVLQERPEEVKKLYEDILINVTSFFRDAESFAALKETVFPKIVKSASPESPIRVWIPGCATGEEAYSIAIALLEFLGEQSSRVSIQVFGTDVEESVISQARLGVYPESIEGDVSPERLRRFFTRVTGGYQISKTIRELCVFALQNLIKDPPFSRLDLISCRNVLIYLGPVLQKKVIPMFHFALRPGGFLMLGKSETIGAFPDLFSLVDKKYKVYAKKATPGHPGLPFPVGGYQAVEGLRPAGPEIGPPPEVWTGMDLLKEADRLVLARFTPPGVIVDEDLKILQFRGHTGPFLEPAAGEASLNLMKMLREGLALEVRSGVYNAIRNQASTRREGLQVRYNGKIHRVNVEIFPLQPGPDKQHFYLIIFEDAGVVEESPEKPPVRTRGASKDKNLEQLRQELAATKEYLQTVIEEQESTVEELKSANEELMSSNEELQSINEELETSKEELQSSNEELATLNEELENRNLELSQVNNDLTNLLGGIHIPIIMLGADLRVRRFNPKAAEILELLPGDLNRPISGIDLGLDLPHLDALVEEVISSRTVKSLEVQDRLERWYSLEIRPYLTSESRVEGAVLTMLDINVVKKSQAQVREAWALAQSTVETVRQPMLVLDAGLKVILGNRTFYESFRVTPEMTLNHRLYELGNRQWNIPKLREVLEDILPHGTDLQDFRVEHTFPHIGPRTMILNARRLYPGLERENILLAIEDVTEKLNMEKRLQELSEKVEQLEKLKT